MDIVGVAVKVLARLFCLVKGINCATTHALLVPAGCGKSWLASNCVSRDEALLLDLDSLSLLSLTKDQLEHLEKLKSEGASQALLLFLLPIFKTFVKETRDRFKSRDIILLTSRPEVMEYLQKLISKKYIFVPSESFSQTILDKVSDAHKKKEMISSRTSIVSQFGKKSRVFNSWADLQSQLSQDLHLTQRI